MYPILSDLKNILEKKFKKDSSAGFDTDSKSSWDWGWRVHPIDGVRTWHNGVDLGAPIGTPIYSPWSGKIIEAWNDQKGKNLNGNAIRINHKGFAPGSIVETAYAHLDRFAPGIVNGAFVTEGQVIGYVGNTGKSTGPHLHFIIRVNPPQIIDDNTRTDINPVPYLLDSVSGKKKINLSSGGIISSVSDNEKTLDNKSVNDNEKALDNKSVNNITKKIINKAIDITIKLIRNIK